MIHAAPKSLAPTCDASAVGDLQVATDGCPNGETSNASVSKVCRCELTAETPTFAWVPDYSPPSVWRERTSGSATGGSGLIASGGLHFPSHAIDLWEDTAGACRQLEYVAGSKTPASCIPR